MKVFHLGKLNDVLPFKTVNYQTGWITKSHYESDASATEAELFKLLGEAIEHHEQMGKAIENLRTMLEVKAK